MTCLSVCLSASYSSVTTTRNLTKSDSNAMISQVKLDPCSIKYHNMKEIFTHGTRKKCHQFHAPTALREQPPAPWVGTRVSFHCSTEIHFLVCSASSLSPTANEVIRLRHDLGGHPKLTVTTWRKQQLMGWNNDLRRWTATPLEALSFSRRTLLHRVSEVSEWVSEWCPV